MGWLKRIALVSAVVFGLSLVAAVPAGGSVYAAPKDDVLDGVNLGGGSGSDGTTEVQGLAESIISILSWIVGIVSVIMIIIGGFQFITSGGDAQKAAKGRQTILYAIVGLVIVAFAQIIVRFVLARI